MKQPYKFLPNDDFSGLPEFNHPFWLGMNMNDFYLMYEQHNQVVGLACRIKKLLNKRVSSIIHCL
ncbi:hypothetical protein ACVBEE_04065 [Acinetobacter sp. ANC 3781]|jgi:hypothetical protein